MGKERSFKGPLEMDLFVEEVTEHAEEYFDHKPLNGS